MTTDVFLPVLTERLTEEDVAVRMPPTLKIDFWEYARRVQVQLNLDVHDLTGRPHVMQQLYDSWHWDNPILDTAEWIADSINLEQ